MMLSSASGTLIKKNSKILNFTLKKSIFYILKNFILQVPRQPTTFDFLTSAPKTLVSIFQKKKKNYNNKTKNTL
jgi:hypothetical protein